MLAPLSARAAILQVLTLRPGSGQDIIVHVVEATVGSWLLGSGSVYPMLETLEAEKKIERVKVEGRRVVYAITPEGRKEAAYNLRVVRVLFP